MTGLGCNTAYLFDKSESPKVSIALPLYNGEATILSSITSIVLQSYQNWELIVLDDGSTDNGPEIVKAIADPRIRFVQDNSNRGISFRLNQALELATGKYFARMDADDIAFPERIERQVHFMESRPDIDLVATEILVFGNDGDVKGRVRGKECHDDITRKPWNGFYMPHPTWLGHIEWFRRHGYRTSADKAEDQDLLFRAYLVSRFACIPEVLLGYRQDTRSLTKMFTARRVLTRSFIETALKRGQYGAIPWLLLNLPVKIIADVLNIKCKISFLRNKLDMVPQEVLLLWQQVWGDTQCSRVSEPVA